ncbi:pro-MCH [Anguilla anguilla]|uniref:pro-MCH n=1 Tax=Anguilla anguilla TaxID=7936 RepID=UPI0015AD9A99|nr:pro-MCH [Anguilla anguilla]
MARLTLTSYTVVFAVALLSKCYTIAASSAIPTGKQDEGRAEQVLNSVMGGEAMAENSIDALASNQNPTWDSGLVEEEGRAKSFVTNFDLKGLSRGTWSPALLQVLRFPKIKEVGATSPEQINVEERRGADEQISIQRKDFTMHNCMLGRMYRPCWQL